MNELPEYIEHLSNICGEEQRLDSVIQSNRGKPVGSELGHGVLTAREDLW